MAIVRIWGLTLNNVEGHCRVLSRGETRSHFSKESSGSVLRREVGEGRMRAGRPFRKALLGCRGEMMVALSSMGSGEVGRSGQNLDLLEGRETPGLLLYSM